MGIFLLWDLSLLQSKINHICITLLNFYKACMVSPQFLKNWTKTCNSGTMKHPAHLSSSSKDAEAPGEASAEILGQTPLKVMLTSWPADRWCSQKRKTSEVPTKTKWSTNIDEQHTNPWHKYKKWDPGEYPAETCIEYEIFFLLKTSKLNTQGHTSGSEAGKTE